MNQTEERQSYITVWRNTPAMGCTLDWGNHVSFNLTDARTAVRKLKERGVTQYYTYVRGPKVDELSCEF
jgi:hypothetical protein